MKRLKKFLAVSTAVFVLSLSLSLPTDCVSAANSNTPFHIPFFPLKRGGTYKTKYTSKSGGHLILIQMHVLSLVTTHEWLTFSKKWCGKKLILLLVMASHIGNGFCS